MSALMLQTLYMTLTTLINTLSGAFVGSYIITILSRKQNHEPLRKTPSHCTTCKHLLKVKDVVPILSYLRNDGKCPYCYTSIGTSTLKWEVGMGILFAIVGIPLFFYLDVYSAGALVIPGIALQRIMKVDE